MNDELYFRNTDKHRSLLHVGTIVLGVSNQVFLKYLKQVCISLQYHQKNMGDQIGFLPADKHRNFYKLIVLL